LLGCYFASWVLCLGIYYVVFGDVRMSDISMRMGLLNAKIRIAELEKEIKGSHVALSLPEPNEALITLDDRQLVYMTADDLDRIKLEQQAKGISDYTDALLKNLECYSVDDVNSFEEKYTKALRDQAKALGEQK
jgi:hypothetical protein